MVSGTPPEMAPTPKSPMDQDFGASDLSLDNTDAKSARASLRKSRKLTFNNFDEDAKYNAVSR